MPRHKKYKYEVIDLFCGIGGLSYGLKSRGFNILAGYDLDQTCGYAYEINNEAVFNYRDIKSVTGKEIAEQYDKKSIKVLVGCAPCQPFSSYAFKNKKKDPNKYDLLYEFGRLIREVRPDVIAMENVTQILRFTEKPVLNDFLALLEELNYQYDVRQVYCPDYGIPQTRKRLVVVASRFGSIRLVPSTHSKGNYVTVRQAIGALPAIASGETYPTDPLHRCTALSPLNLKRIKATPYGGGWKNWPSELVLKCHKETTGRSYGSVYGRMEWDKPGPTMTTQCTGLGNGRFGHPEQDRAISLREAALLQTFPMDYRFFSDEEEVSITKASRYIGNAVPPRLGEVIGDTIIEHINGIQPKI